MRVLLGIILGALLTVGSAYLYNSHTAAAPLASARTAPRPLVNWDVVGSKWQHLTTRARAEWVKLAG